MSPQKPVSSCLTFSPLLQNSGYFLLRYSTLANSFPLGNMVLCVARTFLTCFHERQTVLLYILAKIMDYGVYPNGFLRKEHILFHHTTAFSEKSHFTYQTLCQYTSNFVWFSTDSQLSTVNPLRLLLKVYKKRCEKK